MNLAQIELNLQQLAESPIQKEGFVYDLLLAYETPRSTVSRLRNGSLNKAKHPGDLVWDSKLFFRSVAESGQLQDAFDLNVFTARAPLRTTKNGWLICLNCMKK